MRSLLIALLLVGCDDTAEVPATAIHVESASTCTTGTCGPPYDPFYNSCGPIGSAPLTPETQAMDVTTDYDASKITAYVQLQYALNGRRHIEDRVLRTGERFDVYAVQDSAVLYRFTSAGEITDLDMSRLVAAVDNTMQFQYTADGLTTEEKHVVDEPIHIALSTSAPGISDACCSTAGPHEAGLVVLALLVGLRRRKR